MLSNRSSTLEKLLDLPYQYLDKLQNDAAKACKYGRLPCCNFMQVCVIEGLKSRGLWPRDKTRRIWSSTVMSSSTIMSLAKKLRNLSVYSMQSGWDSHGYMDHDSCPGINFRNEVEKILVEIPSPLLDSHRKHLEAQREKLRCDFSDGEAGGTKDPKDRRRELLVLRDKREGQQENNFVYMDSGLLEYYSP